MKTNVFLKMALSANLDDLALLGIKKNTTGKEYVHLRANKDVELENYIITDSTYENGKISNKVRHVFEFPAWNVGKDENVYLYTKQGTNETIVTNGKRGHRIYWGLNTAIWNDNGDQAHLLFAPVDQRRSVLVPGSK